MARLIVRSIPDDLAAALKARAARSGRSAKAEHRRILEEALRPDQSTSFLEAAQARRIKLAPGAPSATTLLREDRDRGSA